MLVCRCEIESDTSVLEVVVGKHAIERPEKTESRYKVGKIFIHAMYIASMSCDYDIALLKLSTAINFTREVSPVCLPKKDAWVGCMCVATGWGFTHSKRRVYLSSFYSILFRWSTVFFSTAGNCSTGINFFNYAIL